MEDAFVRAIAVKLSVLFQLPTAYMCVNLSMPVVPKNALETLVI